MMPIGTWTRPGRDLLVGLCLAAFLVSVYRVGTPPHVALVELPEPQALELTPDFERLIAVLETWGRAGDLVPSSFFEPGVASDDQIRFASTTGPLASPLAAPADVRRDAFGQVVRDLVSMTTFRPAFSFWQNVFLIRDGAVAYGDASDGRLLAVVPERGAWRESPEAWAEEPLASLLDGERLAMNPTQRREQVTALLEPIAGRIVSNPTRGALTLRSLPAYGSFLADWGEIYEHFGVPAEIGLAQAMIESGWGPRVRSEARAIGFCQWLEPNWNRMKRLAHSVIEAYNQTTQAAYCAAYLRVLATKYGSFIPALSEHHAGGANVGRAVINGGRLGGRDTREQYLMGAQFAREIREISTERFQDVVETYGPRSFRYTEMVFANAATVARLRSERPQEPIYAMRVARPTSLQGIMQRTGLTREEVQRFNPALVQQVPAGATLYLPFLIEDFGHDVTFWRAEMSREYTEVLQDFIRLAGRPEQWDDPAFEPLLQEYLKRFEATNTEQGSIMATVLAYTIQETFQGRRGAILAEFRTSDRILTLFEEARTERNVRYATEDQ